MEKAEAKGTQHSSQFEPKSESSPNKQLRAAQPGNHAKFINVPRLPRGWLVSR